MTRRNTRELILDTSLELFNTLGEPNVTTNHIADEADISPGNLYYHFRKKDEIVLELFKRFALRFSPLLELPPNIVIDADDLWFQLHLSFEIKGEFRFIYRNLSDLTARIPEFEKAMRGLLRLERESALNSLSGLQANEIISLDEQRMQALADNLLLSLTYWLAYSEFFEGGEADDVGAQSRAISRLLLMVTPHMREPERSDFVALATRYLE